MAIPYERLVEEDFNRGYGSVSVTMPGGGAATGRKVGLHTFTSESVFNVKDFGAIGDGTADDTVAIDAAKAAVVAAGGGVLYFPEGTFCFDYTNSDPTYGIYISSAMIVQGSGVQKTILKNLSTSAAGMRCANGYIYVRDLTIDQNGSTGNAFQHGGQYSCTENVNIEDQGGTGYAYVLDGCTLSMIKDVHLFRCTYGFRVANTAAQFLSFVHCSAETTTGVGLDLTSAAGCTFNQMYFEDSSDAGNMLQFMKLTSCEDLTFIGVGCEAGTRTLTEDEYFLLSSCKNVSFRGTRINHNTTASKVFFRVEGTTNRNLTWENTTVISTKSGMTLFELNASATAYGFYQRDTYTNLSSAATGVLHTSAAVNACVENWVDNGSASAHTFSAQNLYVVNVPGAIATGTLNNQCFINCEGTFTGTGATAEGFRINSGPTGSRLAIPSDTGIIPVYADNAAALSGGLVAGQVYRTSAGAMMVVN